MEKDFIVEAESMKDPEKHEQIRLSEEKIEELKGVIQRLGSDLDQLELKKDLLIVENNKLRGLLEGWIAAYPVVAVTCDHKNFVKIQELLDKTNEVLG